MLTDVVGVIYDYGLQNRPTDVDVCDRKKLHFDSSRS